MTFKQNKLISSISTTRHTQLAQDQVNAPSYKASMNHDATSYLLMLSKSYSNIRIRVSKILQFVLVYDRKTKQHINIQILSLLKNKMWHLNKENIYRILN